MGLPEESSGPEGIFQHVAHRMLFVLSPSYARDVREIRRANPLSRW